LKRTKPAAKPRSAVKRKPAAKAVKPVPKALKAAAPAAAGQGRVQPLRLLLLLALAGSLFFPLKSILATKLAQHVFLRRTVPILEQGEAPGRLSGLLGLKSDADGGIVTLSRMAAAFRVQRFNASLTPTACTDLDVKTSMEMLDLAVLPEGKVLLLGPDGRGQILDPRLKPQGKPFFTGLSHVSGVDGRDGVILALDAMDGQVGRLDAGGRLIGTAADLPQAAGARCIAALPDGAYALLLPRQSQTVAQVFSKDDRLLRSIVFKDVAPANPVRLAAMGEVLAVNDATGPIGISFYHSSGKPLGNCIGIDHDPVAFPGFVAGEPTGRFGYIHFGAGLLKVALPWQEGG
jgi:hypothetical protein